MNQMPIPTQKEEEKEAETKTTTFSRDHQTKATRNHPQSSPNPSRTTTIFRAITFNRDLQTIRPMHADTLGMVIHNAYVCQVNEVKEA